jgi:hypothetical protein
MSPSKNIGAGRSACSLLVVAIRFQNLAKPSYDATYDPRCHHFDDVGHRGIASDC